MSRREIFDFIQAKRGKPWAAAEIPLVDALLDELDIAKDVAAAKPTPAKHGELTARVALELVGHEAIVLEWYKDSVGVGTWGIGVTNNSGHSVDRYKDNPQTVEKVLQVYIWLLRTVYIPDVLKAFAGHLLTETQFAAALSFHYNTGAILKTEWVKMFLAGNWIGARKFLVSHYLNGGTLTERREAEAALFFDGDWKHEDGKALVIPVRKPSYTPNFGKAQRVGIRADMERALAG